MIIYLRFYWTFNCWHPVSSTYTMEFFEKIVNDWNVLPFFAKRSFLDVWQNSECTLLFLKCFTFFRLTAYSMILNSLAEHQLKKRGGSLPQWHSLLYLTLPILFSLMSVFGSIYDLNAHNQCHIYGTVKYLWWSFDEWIVKGLELHHRCFRVLNTSLPLIQ